MFNYRIKKQNLYSFLRSLPQSVVLGVLTLLVCLTSTASGQNQDTAQLSSKLQQALMSVQQQVGWLEQEAVRSRAVAMQASQESTALKKDLEEISKGTEAIQVAETKARQALVELEAKQKEQQQSLKQLEEEIAPDAEAEKEKRTKLEGLQKRAAETRQASEKSASTIQAYEQAIEYNQQRRSAWVEVIAKLESEVRTKQENELQIGNQLESLTGEAPKLQKNLERLKQLVFEQQVALKSALAETQKRSSSVKDQAVSLREGVTAKPAAQTPAPDATETKQSEAATAPGSQDEAKVNSAADKKEEPQPAATQAAEDSKSVSSLTSTLENCQGELSKLQESYLKLGQQSQSWQASLQEYQASQLKLFELQHRLRAATVSQKLATEASTTAKDAVAAAEKELDAIKKSTNALKEKLAVLEKEHEKQIEDAAGAAKVLANFAKDQVAEGVASSLASKVEQARAAKQQSVASEAEITATKSKLEQLTKAVAHNTQHHSQRQWFSTVAEELVELRKLEEAAANSNLASAKQTAEALTAAIQNLSQKK